MVSAGFRKGDDALSLLKKGAPLGLELFLADLAAREPFPQNPVGTVADALVPRAAAVKLGATNPPTPSQITDQRDQGGDDGVGQNHRKGGDKRQRLANFEQALAYFSQALDLDPGNNGALFERGRTFISLGRFEDAVAEYDALIAVETDNPTAFFNRALAYENLDNFAAAVADYTSSIALDPANLDAYSRRARGHAKLMEYEAAVADYTAILEQEAFNTPALRSRG